jgi:hypothetical protein
MAAMLKLLPQDAARAGVLLFYGVLAVAFAWRPVTDSDVWYHLAAGRLLLRDPVGAWHDSWTFTAEGQRWIAQSWLHEMILYGTYAASGVTGLVILKCLLVAGALAMVDKAARLGDMQAQWRWPLLVLAATAASGRLMDRPQLVTFALSPLVLWLLERRARSEDRRTPQPPNLWWLVPIFWVWGNCHAGVIYGYGLMGAYGLDRLVRQWRGGAGPLGPWVWPCITAAVASVAGPNHLLTPLYPVIVLPKLRAAGFSVTEFETDPAVAAGWLRWLVAGVVAVWLLAARHRPLREVLVVAGLGVFAFRWHRERAYFFLMMVPLAAWLLSDWAARWPGWRRHRFAPTIACAALWVAALAPAGSLAARLNRDVAVGENIMPRRLVDFYLEHRLPARVFNFQIWGGYLVWRGEGQLRVFLDPRMEIYSKQVLEDFLAIQRDTPSRNDLLRRYGVEAVILDYGERYPGRPGPQGQSAGLYAGLFADPAWTLVYWDDDGMIYLPEEIRAAHDSHLPRWTAVNPDDTRLEYLDTAEKLSAAATELERFVAAYPEVWRAQRLLGHVLIRMQRHPQAVEIFGKLIERLPRPTAADYHSYAFALDATGRKADALAAANAGLDRWPKDTNLLDFAAILFAETGDPAAGLRLLERAARIGPPSPERDTNIHLMRRQAAMQERP